MSQRPIHIDLAPSDPANIRAQDDAFWLAGLLGATGNNISCILPVGNRFAISKTSNNEVVLQSGAYVMQGFVIEIPDSESFAIASGAQGKKRLDLIVAEYKKGTPRSAYSLKVIQGTQGDDYIAPELTVQDLHAGGTTRQEKIAEVKIDGIDIVSQVVTAITIRGISELAGLIADHNHDTKYLGKTAKAADSDKLDGYDQSGENVPSTIVRRTSYGTVHATTLTEDGIPLQDKYLGKTAKAADSAKLDGREVSWEPVAGGIPRWSSPEKAIKADEFRENNVKLENKYLQTTAPRPPAYNLNDLFTPGIFSSQETPFVNYPKGAYLSGKYGIVLVLRRDGSGGRNQIYLDSNGDIFSRVGASSGWGDWITLSGALYGTGSPPSSLLPGQIYVQY